MAKKKSKNIEYNEKYNLITIFIGIFLFYSLSSNSMGIVGSILQSVFKGLFGGLSIIVPLCIICIGILDFFDANDYIYKIKKSKTHYILIVYLFLFYGLLNKESLPVDNPLDPQMLRGVIDIGISGEGPGFVSTFMAYYITKAFGETGAWLVSIGALTIVLVSMFNISLKDFAIDVKNKAKNMKKENMTTKEFFSDFKNNILNIFIDEVDEETIVKNKKKNTKKNINPKVKEDFEEDKTIKIVGFNKAEDDYLEILEGTQSNISELEGIREIKRFSDEKVDNIKEEQILISNSKIDEISIFTNDDYIDYKLPNTNILNKSNTKSDENSKAKVLKNATLLEQTLKNFGVDAKISQATIGPSITRYEIQPSPGVKVSKIVNLSDDIALSLAAKSIRIEAPIPGKSAVGIEVPNDKPLMVTLREVFESNEFKNFNSKLPMALGKDLTGNPIIADISKMPHLLVAGSTGSGKSVCVNSLITSILYKAKPNEVKLLLIDPKVVELSNYNGIPHLLVPVVTDPKKAAGALNWAVNEMDKRYNLFSKESSKDIISYNEKVEEKLPRIVIIIDELADLMMSSANDVEDYICRLAQKARACGIHLIVATQRPSVDVITGVIKANIPSRIAFAVSSQTDSRTILDMGGAEKLLGKGDMLFYPLGETKPIRIQGAFISEEESEKIIEFVKSQVKEEIKYEENIQNNFLNQETLKSSNDDELLKDAIEFVIDSNQASSSMLQRRFKIGFNRAARLIDSMEERGIVGKSEGSKPRKVLITRKDLEGEN